MNYPKHSRKRDAVEELFKSNLRAREGRFASAEVILRSLSPIGIYATGGPVQLGPSRISASSCL